jgi:hypothetical protein
MYDPDSDDLKPLSIYARQIPNRDGRLGINVSSTWRWSLKGLKGHRLRTQFSHVPIAAFTATATERVRHDIVKQLALREPRIHVASFNRPNLYYAVRPKSRATYPEVIEQARRDRGAGIIYCLSRKRVDELAGQLQGDGIPIDRRDETVPGEYGPVHCRRYWLSPASYGRAQELLCLRKGAA